MQQIIYFESQVIQLLGPLIVSLRSQEAYLHTVSVQCTVHTLPKKLVLYQPTKLVFNDYKPRMPTEGAYHVSKTELLSTAYTCSILSILSILVNNRSNHCFLNIGLIR